MSKSHIYSLLLYLHYSAMTLVHIYVKMHVVYFTVYPLFSFFKALSCAWLSLCNCTICGDDGKCESVWKVLNKEAWLIDWLICVWVFFAKLYKTSCVNTSVNSIYLSQCRASGIVRAFTTQHKAVVTDTACLLVNDVLQHRGIGHDQACASQTDSALGLWSLSKPLSLPALWPLKITCKAWKHWHVQLTRSWDTLTCLLL